MAWEHPDDRLWLEQLEEQREREFDHDQALAKRDRREERGPQLSVELHAAMLDVRSTDEWNELGTRDEVLVVLRGWPRVLESHCVHEFDVTRTFWPELQAAGAARARAPWWRRWFSRA